ncbi:MAG: hypothetical protein JW798_04380 [Prolixibacteraceae bacterium]|nr:hypothetical protein [Prolixibacteraceae bacterium]
MKKQLLAILLLFYSLTGYTLQSGASFKRYSTKEGLSNNWVRCVYHDSYGYMWFGTSSGLNRFDGAKFKIYKPVFTDSLEQGNVTINAIIEKDSFNLWICTDIGMYLYNYLTDKLVLYELLEENFPLLCCTYDDENCLWIGSNRGLIKLDKEGKVEKIFIYDPSNPSSISSNYVNTIFFDSYSNLLAGTKNGLNIYSRETNKFKRYLYEPKRKTISGNDVLSILEDGEKRIWLGTAFNGLKLCEWKSDELVITKIIEGSINSLMCDDLNNLWIGHGSGGGLDRISLNNFSPTNLKITHFENEPTNPRSIGGNSIFCIYQDRLNDIWLGTFSRGVNYYSQRAKKFYIVDEMLGSSKSINNNLVNAFYEDSTYLWVGTEGGLDRFHKKKGVWQHFKYENHNPNSLASDPVFKIYQDSRDNLWIGNWAGGLNLYNPSTNNFTRYLPGDEPGSISNENVFDILEDSRGNLWVSTVGGGLNRYDYNSGLFEQFKNNPQNVCSINGNFCNNILETSDGQLYLSLYNLIDRYNYDTQCFEHIIHNPKSSDYIFYANIYSLFEDSRKNIWIATNAGLEYFDPYKNAFRKYTTKDGLPDNSILGVLEDDHGNFWIGTNNGLSKFINAVELPDEPEFVNFTVYDGLPANDFKKRAAYKNNEGKMYFGTSSGFVWFYPDSIILNETISPVVLTDFSLFNPSGYGRQWQNQGGNINFIKQIEISYNNSDFTISFASLNYLNPEKNRYKYKLEGFSDDWHYTSGATSATYTNVQPGDYTFMVAASNNDGFWNPVPKTIAIKVIPLWWQTMIFRISLIILMAFLIFWLVWSRMSNLRKYNRMLEKSIAERTSELIQLNTLLKNKQEKISEQNIELSKHKNELEDLVHERTIQLEKEKVKAEESFKIKSSFLANMSHEIRTPLNAILGFTSLLSENSLDEEHRKKYIELIASNSKLLFFLINDIIDISIIESNQLVLNITRFNARRILADFKNFYNQPKDMPLEFIYANAGARETLFLENDAVRFRQVMSNLINNAFKYTKSGKIEYGYQHFRDKILFYVSDTGIGIPVEDHQKIFEEFYKGEQEKQKLYGGTGIGLALCRRLVSQMGGKIWVDSQIGKGSTFYFNLPY